MDDILLCKNHQQGRHDFYVDYREDTKKFFTAIRLEVVTVNTSCESSEIESSCPISLHLNLQRNRDQDLDGHDLSRLVQLEQVISVKTSYFCSEIASELTKCSRLTSLYLNLQCDQDLDGNDLSRLVHLEQLCLDRWQLRKEKESCSVLSSGMPRLRCLLIQNCCPAPAVAERIFSDLSQDGSPMLDAITFKKMEFSKVPASFLSHQTDLTAIDLDQTSMRWIPVEVSNLTRLRQLRMPTTKIYPNYYRIENYDPIEPSRWLAEMRSLVSLAITIPKEDSSDECGNRPVDCKLNLRSLDSLRTVSLDCWQLERSLVVLLPHGLTELDLYNYGLPKFPEVIFNLTALRKLCLDGPPRTDRSLHNPVFYPLGFPRLHLLTCLELQGRFAYKPSPEIGHLRSLRDLFINRSQRDLRKLPPEWFRLPGDLVFQIPFPSEKRLWSAVVLDVGLAAKYHAIHGVGGVLSLLQITILSINRDRRLFPADLSTCLPEELDEMIHHV